MVIGKNIALNNSLWNTLESLINTYWPDFKMTVDILSDNKIGDVDWCILMLIKLKFKPNDIANLIAMSKSGVASRRSRLAIKLFGVKISTNHFDKLICCM